jgi:hypothetical protein
LCVDRCRRLCADHHAITRNPAIAELLRLDVAQARDHLVTEGAGGERPARLDQRDLQARIQTLQRAGAGRAAEAAADHDHAGLCLRARGQRQGRCCRGDAEESFAPCERARIHGHDPKPPRRPFGRRGLIC